MSRTKYANYNISGRGTTRFGQWLRQLRLAGKLTLRQVAAKADMDQAILSKVELGQRVPTPEQARGLARFFGVEEQQMQARRIAEKFRQDHEADGGAAREAILMLAEEAGRRDK